MQSVSSLKFSSVTPEITSQQWTPKAFLFFLQSFLTYFTWVIAFLADKTGLFSSLSRYLNDLHATRETGLLPQLPKFLTALRCVNTLFKLHLAAAALVLGPLAIRYTPPLFLPPASCSESPAAPVFCLLDVCWCWRCQLGRRS